MKVKPTDPNAVILDPVTLQRLPADGGDVPDNVFWRRRLRDGDVVLMDGAAQPTPTGDEPVAPLTTRKAGK